MAIDRFEKSTGQKPFSKFHVEQARAFRRNLADERGPYGKPLSAATVTSTLRHLKSFFLWLSREPGYRSRLNPNDATYFRLPNRTAASPPPNGKGASPPSRRLAAC